MSTKRFKSWQRRRRLLLSSLLDRHEVLGDRGLTMSYVYGGAIGGPLSAELKKHGLSCLDYIDLESQLGGKSIERDEKTHAVLRKPVKTKKKISPENARSIPLLDKASWSILARTYKVQKQQFDEGTFGLNKDNYLLFDNMSMSVLSNTLRETYQSLFLKLKSFHCCRPSRVTYLARPSLSFWEKPCWVIKVTSTRTTSTSLR
jgi:hypothetical protein